jgi:two-component sensor histidine kinase
LSDIERPSRRSSRVRQYAVRPTADREDTVSEEFQVQHPGEVPGRRLRSAAVRERALVERIRGLEQRTLELAVEREQAWNVVEALEDTLRRRDQRIEQVEFHFREAAHRMQNTFAAVQGMAERIARTAPSTDDFLRAFRPRLVALVRAQQILAAERWAGARLSRLVRMAVDPYLTNPDQLDWQDDDVMLPGRSATPVFMALHELATNAAKYGALTVPRGRVRGEGTVHPDVGEVRVVWQEVGGPPVTPQVPEGFGLTVIRRGVTHELGGTVDVRFEPAGVHATLVFPLPEAAAYSIQGEQATEGSMTAAPPRD